MKVLLRSVVCLCVLSMTAWAGNKQDISGLPYIRNYSAKEYGAHTQNWAITQDARGVMYFGNTSGILEYDGASWRLIPLLGATPVVFSLAIDSTGTIYVGSYNELGYLTADAVGQLQYVSLVNQLPEKYRQFANVWRTFATDSAVYFTTSKYILRWQDGQFKVWQTETRFFLSFYVRGHLYVRQKDVGLMVMQGDTLATIQHSKKIVQDGLTAILPFDDGRLMMVTNKRVFLFDGSRFEPFSLRPSNLAEDVLFYVAAKIGTDVFALATRNSGILIFNKKGDLLTRLDKSIGLQDESVSYLFKDREGALWVAFNNGISRVDVASPASYFDDRLGLKGKVQQCLRHNGTLYIATNAGLYAIMSQGTAIDGLPNILSPIPTIGGACWDLLAVGSTLLVSNRSGIYALDRSEPGKQLATFIAEYSAIAFVRSRGDSNRVFLALKDGLASIYRDVAQEGGAVRWRDSGRITGVHERIRWLAQGRDNELWLSTSFSGVIRVTFDASGSLNNPTIAHFDTADGLPSMRNNRVFPTDESVLFGTRQGVFIFDKTEQLFRPAPGFDAPIFRQREVYRIASVPGSRDLRMVLFGDGYEAGLARAMQDGRYDWFSAPFMQFADLQINEIYPEADEVVWLGTSEGLIRYDTSVDKNYDLDYPALIRRITVAGDSVIFGGAGRDGEQSPAIPVLEYGDNALRFEYSAAVFDGNAANRFQYFLDGFDHAWSDWTEETRKDYTNLPEGAYYFRVRAKNVYGHLSAEDGFSFEILPLWYRTFWAYLAYIIALAWLFMSGVRWRSRNLVREKEALEKIVAGRTEEVRSQAEKLKEMDKLKSHFFANISHEFRTPLTLILDPLDEIITGSFKGNLKKRAEVMRRNARRLLRLINQLLDLSKLESGGMALRASQQPLVPFVRMLVAAFESQAEIKKIELNFQADEVVSSASPNLILYFEQDKLEKIITNLISNSFKFTPDGGKITVAVEQNAMPEHPSKAAIKITIKDTGVGIAAERLPFIFDRFYKIDSAESRAQEGVGIGLALTRELVELHHGKIDVRSELGHGTEFAVYFQLGREHLTEAEIVEVASPVPISDINREVVGEQVTQSTLVGDPAKPKAANTQDGLTVVLVVEDNVDVRTYICEHLTQSYKVLQAADGVEGLAVAGKAMPDIIISDVMMPNMDGIELCRKLKQDIKTSHIPIILLTARAGQEHKIEGLETGVDEYLIKPFNSQELLIRVRNLIESRKQIQEKYRREFLLEPEQVAAVSMDDEFLQHARQVVEEHISDTEFSVKELSKSVAMSRGHLHRKLRALTGQSVQQFIRAVRLKRAAQLLRQRAGNITEIAFEVGFQSSAYFTKSFKEQFGILPRDFAEDSP